MLNNFDSNYKISDQSIKKQERDFLENEKTYKKIEYPNIKFMENQNTLGTIKEAMQSRESSQSNENYKEDYNQDLENKFNKTLSQYNLIQKQINEDLLKKEQSKSKIKNYLGKVITEDDENYKYVNNYGYTHRYSDDSWSNNNTSCPLDPTKVKSFSSFKLKGPDMGNGQPCKIAGKNIKNETTTEIAWIDIKGYKHIYPEDVWNNKNKTCNINPITVSDSEYNSIPTGNPMTNTYICNQIDINPNMWEKLITLNKKLKNLAYKMLKEIEKLNTEDEKINEYIIEKKKIILVNIDNIEENRKNIFYNRRQLVNVYGEEEDSELYMNSFYYRYIFWFIIAIMIIVITFRNLNNVNVEGDLKIILAIFLIGFLVILYKRYND